MRLVFPPALAVGVMCVLWPTFALLFTAAQECAFLSGGFVGYIFYDLTHYYLHHGRPFGPFRRLKRRHMDHHYRDYRRDYGITSDWWDVVFGTQSGGRDAADADVDAVADAAESKSGQQQPPEALASPHALLLSQARPTVML